MITKEFILAGRAIFTLEVPETFASTYPTAFSPKPHYTFKVSHKAPNGQYPETWFVNVLAGPDNRADYVYLGQLEGQSGEVRLTKKSRYTKDSWPVRLLGRALKAVWDNRAEEITRAGFEIHHEGKCGRCGRKLTVPASIVSGFGPECVQFVNNGVR